MNKIVPILLNIIILCQTSGQSTSKIQLIAKYEMNMSWISPTLIDSTFFSYDSFNYVGFSEFATDCYDIGFDVIEPPTPLGNWSRLTIPHDDIGYGDCWENDFNANNFTQDIRYKDHTFLESDYYEWNLEFNSFLAPGKVKIFFMDDEYNNDCNLLINHNGVTQDFSYQDTLEFWNFISGFSGTNEILLKLGECDGLWVNNKDNIKNSNIIFYPNPFNSNINISFFSDQIFNSKLIIFDLSGKKIISKSFKSNIGKNIHSLNLPKYIPSGTYIMKFSSNNLNFTDYLLYLK